MNKEKMIKVGFPENVQDEILVEAWASLGRFFGSDEDINKKLDEVIAKQKVI